MSINQLTVSDEYTCHEEVTVVCITTNPVSNKIKKWRVRFIHDLILYYKSHTFQNFQTDRNN